MDDSMYQSIHRLKPIRLKLKVLRPISFELVQQIGNWEILPNSADIFMYGRILCGGEVMASR